jgi:tRNA(Ile)-lysidine synthase
LHVDHGLRGDESDEDARWCAERFGAEVVQSAARCSTEAALRDVRYSFRTGELRATGHTLSDQVETILYRLAASGTTKGIKVAREDGVVRPLLCAWREETEAFCRERGLEWRTDSSNPGTLRGLIRDQVLPLLARIHPAARENILRALDERRTMPAALAELLDSPAGSRRLDLGGGVQAVREHDRLWLEEGPKELHGALEWGRWRIESELPGLKVRGWRPGDRLAGRSKKIQDVFVDAKIPRSDREAWPLVVRGDEVVAVPGIVEAEGVTATRVAD